MNELVEPVQILLVDDERDVTDALMWLLESVNIQSRAFSSASEFLAALPTIRGPVCAVFDLRMPEMSGLELQQRLLDENLDIPLIFLTAHGDVPAAVTAMQTGAVDFVQKPFNPQGFLASINRISRLARERHAHRQLEHAFREQLARLSTREREVLDGLLDGRTSKEIARLLNISPKTVDVHRANLLRKMMVNSGAELVRLFSGRRHSAEAPAKPIRNSLK
jgi:two-component system, LuxR family, response regulator FixJ